MKKAIVIITEGSEEMEAVTPIDTLRRGGVEVTVAGLLDDKPICGSLGTILGPEMSLSEAIPKGPYDAVIIPGGLRAADNLIKSEMLKVFLEEQHNAGRIIATICAAARLFRENKLFWGKKLTSHPRVNEVMREGDLFQYVEDRVAVDGNLITSRGPGTALEWSLTIAEKLIGKEKTGDLKKAMLVN